jgi:hypothetical protein
MWVRDPRLSRLRLRMPAASSRLNRGGPIEAAKQRLKLGVSLCLASLLSAHASCTSLKPGDVLPDATSSPLDDAGCDPVHPPERPRVSDTAADDEAELVFVVRYFDLGYDETEDGTPSYRQLGYDLDGLCTGQQDGPSCAQPPWQSVPVDDEPGGRDVSANALLYEAASLPVSPEQRPFASLERDADVGRGSIAVRLRGYNREPDDAHVDIAAFSVTMWPTQQDGPRPRWNGDDTWHAGSPWIAEDGPRFRDADAYVKSGVFVARFPTWLFGFAYIPYGTLQDVVLTGRLVSGEAGLSIQDGVITGRWPIDNLLNAIAREESARPAETVCVDEEIVTLARTLFCNKVDLSLSSDDASQPCDAVSAAFGFKASAAKLGEPVDIPEVFHAECRARDCNDQPLAPPQ